MEADVVTLRERLGAWGSAHAPLYESLAHRIAELVQDGELPPGERLPSERRLAVGLGVSRGTVMAAYERLRGDHVVETRHGSGTVVRADASPVTGPRESHVAAALSSHSIWSGVLAEDDTIDLRGAYWSDAEDLPADVFALSQGDDGAALLADHGYRPLGLPGLRTGIARHLSDQGLPTDAEQVLVTSGAQQAIALVAELLVAPDDTVVLEELTYPGALDALVARQARLRTAPLGAKGVDVGKLTRIVEQTTPRLVYVVADCHNPTGVVMPTIARRRLAELVTRWPGVLIDDRTLAHTAFDGAGFPPPVAAFAADPDARIVTIGSMSKAFWGGLRIGWIRAPQRMLARLARLKTVDDLGTSTLSQLAAQRLLQRSAEVLPRRQAAAAERHGVLTEALRRRLPEWEWVEPTGGLCLWVRAPGADTAAFAAVAARHGVGIAPGSVSAPAGGWRDHLRVPFGQPPAVLGEAVDRLAAAWEEYRHGLERCDRVHVVV